MRVLDLFAGIGGFTIGLERAGFETVAFCEIEPYAQKVLRKNWPEVPIYDDVRTITADRLASDGIGVDVITGGFPCQDISVAGNQAGIQDGTRSGLWSECARLLGELQPRYAIFENVTNLLNGERGDWFKRVLWDISEVGYDAEWHCIPASELGAHHHRDRVWIIAYPSGQHGRDDGQLATNQTQWAQSTAIPSAIREDVSDSNSGEQSVGVDGSELKGSSEIASTGQESSGRRSRHQDVADANDNGSSSTEESRGVTSRGNSSEAGQEQASQSEGLRATKIDEDVADTDSARQQQSNEALARKSSEQFDSARIQSRKTDVSNSNESRLQRWLQDGIAYQAGWEVESIRRATECGFGWERYRDGYWSSEPDVGRVVDGIPNRSHRLKCLGNAVVPPIPELIGRAIKCD